jgi:hypothetical protein
MRVGYVHGNPVTMTDPTGKKQEGNDGGGSPPSSIPPSQPGGDGDEGYCTSVTCNDGNGKTTSGSGSSSSPDSAYNQSSSSGYESDILQLQQPKKPNSPPERKAYQDAVAARNGFQQMANNFSSLPVEIISFLASIAALKASPLWAGFVAGFFAAFNFLSHLAGDIAGAFQAQTDQVDLVPGASQEKYNAISQGLSFFTAYNVRNQGDQILRNIVTEGGYGAVTGLGVALGSIVIGTGIAVFTGFIPLAEGVIFGGVSAGATEGSLVAFGAKLMYNDARDAIVQEYNDAAS